MTTRRRTVWLLGSLLAVAAVIAASLVITRGQSHRPRVVEAATSAPGSSAASPAPTPPVAEPTTVPPTTVPPTTTPPTSVATPAETLRRDDEGDAVVELQDRLSGLGYWLGGSDGSYGLLVEQAVTAFQKVEGLSPDGVAGPATRAALAEARRPTTAAASGADLIEVDRDRQVLIVVRDGAVAWTLDTSTGTNENYQVDGRTELADTPAGHWEVQWVVDGVDVGPLGALYRPRYFHPDGIAVHGYSSVPAAAASHGCVRVSEAAMDWIWANDLMPIGSEVWVH